MKQGEFGTVVIYNLNSLSIASADECMEIVSAIEEAGAGIKSVCDAWVETTAPGVFFGRHALQWAFGFQGKVQGKRISQGIARRRAEAVQRGEPAEWGRALGNTLSKDTALVSEIVRLRDSGLSLSKTAAAVGKPKTTVARLERVGRHAHDGHAAGADADVPDSE